MLNLDSIKHCIKCWGDECEFESNLQNWGYGIWMHTASSIANAILPIIEKIKNGSYYHGNLEKSVFNSLVFEDGSIHFSPEGFKIYDADCQFTYTIYRNCPVFSVSWNGLNAYYIHSEQGNSKLSVTAYQDLITFGTYFFQEKMNPKDWEKISTLNDSLSKNCQKLFKLLQKQNLITKKVV